MLLVRMDLMYCPSCGQPAEIEWRTHLGGTGGPVEHVKLQCLARHHFLMPADGLVTMTEPVRTVDAHR
jgi:hypothetical protein